MKGRALLLLSNSAFMSPFTISCKYRVGFVDQSTFGGDKENKND